MKRYYRAIKGLWLTALIIMTGCASQPHPSLYLLAATPDTAIGEVAGVISVGPVTIRSYLDRDQLLVFKGSVPQSDGDAEWAEPLRYNVTQVLVANLAHRLEGAQVVTRSGLLGADAAYHLAVELHELKVEQGGEALLVASWRIKDNDGEQEKISTSRHQVSVDSSATQERVDAKSLLLSRLSEDIAVALVEISQSR